MQEFEQLIDQHGAEQVTSLMQKVISALEHLEVLVQHNEAEQEVIEDLNKTIEHLEHEESKKADERIKYARLMQQQSGEAPAKDGDAPVNIIESVLSKANLNANLYERIAKRRAKAQRPLLLK